MPELVSQNLNPSTADGEMNTYTVHPSTGGPFPLILLLMDAPGVRAELRQMADRLAAAGYFVALPNLYYRRVREFVLRADNREAMIGHMNSLTNAMVCADCLALVEALDGHVMVDSGAIGCVGYCMSGPFAFALASALPERVAAAASIHGVRLFHTGSHSPHRHAHRIRGELYFGCAEHDDWAPRDMIDGLDAFLGQLDVSYCIEWYPGTTHGFVFPERPAYRAGAAETHWQRLFALFGRRLSAPAASL